MNDCHGVLEWIFGLFSQKRVSNQEPAQEKEHVNCEERSNNKQEEPNFDLCFNIDRVDIVMESDAVLMTQDDPEHAERFYTVEDIEDVVFVFEYFEGFVEVEGIEESHGEWGVVSKFGDSVDVGGEEGQEHEQEDEDDDRVEEPLFLNLDILGVVDHLPNIEPCSHLTEHGIEPRLDKLMPVGVALFRQTQPHVQPCVGLSGVGSLEH